MLGKKKQAQIRSSIGAGMRVAGDCSFQDELQVEGTILGDVQAEDNAPSVLRVQSGGRIEGTVSADHIVVAGLVVGRVLARERLELVAGGRIEGDVCYKSLEMQPGAVVAGLLQPQALLPAAATPVPALQVSLQAESTVEPALDSEPRRIDE